MSTPLNCRTRTVAYRESSPIAPADRPSKAPVADLLMEPPHVPVTAPRKAPATTQAPIPKSIQTPKTTAPATHPPPHANAPKLCPRQRVVGDSRDPNRSTGPR